MTTKGNPSSLKISQIYGIILSQNDNVEIRQQRKICDLSRQWRLAIVVICHHLMEIWIRYLKNVCSHWYSPSRRRKETFYHNSWHCLITYGLCVLLGSRWFDIVCICYVWASIFVLFVYDCIYILRFEWLNGVGGQSNWMRIVKFIINHFHRIEWHKIEEYTLLANEIDLFFRKWERNSNHLWKFILFDIFTYF